MTRTIERACGKTPLLWLLAVSVMAVVLRCLRIDAVFGTSDQAAMPYFIHHNFGLKWVFAHDYGPVLALFECVWARLLCVMHIPVSEAATRAPIVLLSLAQVAMTFPLLRRLRCTESEAFAGLLCAALLPPFVCDAHYGWAYHTVWLLNGTIALWATLAYLDERRMVHLLAAGLFLFLHCLSALYAFALPLTILTAWWWREREERRPREGESTQSASARDRRLAAWTLGFLMPCLAALATLALSYAWTGGGQIGRLLVKKQTGTVGLQFHQLLGLPGLFVSQLGYLAAAAAMPVFCAAALALWRRERVGLLAFWAAAGVLPVALLADWQCVGYPQYYFFEVVYALALLVAVHAVRVCRAFPKSRAAVAAYGTLAGLGLCLGSVQVAYPDAGVRWATGVSTGWGDVRSETGIKAAGCYVRERVPLDATVLCLHTHDGMELPVAEYYCGRKVLAHYDLRESILPVLLQRMRGQFDVVIAAAAQEPLLAGMGLHCVCTLRRDGEPVRRVYARPELSLPSIDVEVAVLNERYDWSFQPRRVPLPLPAAGNFLPRLQQYQQAIREAHTVRSELAQVQQTPWDANHASP